jgi:hypothetical protein
MPANSSLTAGKWKQSRLVGMELSNKTLGILGLGKVGREVARLAQAFSMRVLGFDPGVAVGQAQRAGVRMLSKAEVLQQVDFVMLHAALPSVSGGVQHSSACGNCAGGSLIDEAALLAALDQGRLAGAALDVFSQEPMGDDRILRRLLAHERVIATPHLGPRPGRPRHEWRRRLPGMSSRRCGVIPSSAPSCPRSRSLLLPSWSHTLCLKQHRPSTWHFFLIVRLLITAHLLLQVCYDEESRVWRSLSPLCFVRHTYRS